MQFVDAKLKNVDFRTSELSRIRGLESLKDAKISSLQLVTLAPELAQALGINVED